MDSKLRIKAIDELGRLVIPKDMRRNLGIEPGTDLEISSEGDTIFVRRAVSRCVFCSNTEHLVEFKGLNICPECLGAVKRLREV